MQHHVSTFQILGNHGGAKPYACKSGILGETSKLDRAGSCAFALIDGVRHVHFTNVCFIGCVIDDDRARLIGIVHPFLQLRLGNSRSGRVIRETQIDDIRRFFRQLGRESGLFRTRHVDHIAPCLRLLVIDPGTPGHYVRIYIDGIDWVAYGNLIILREYFLDISGIALCSI